MNENKLSIYIKIFLCFLIHINFCEGDENIYKSSSNVYTNTIEFKNVKFKVLKEGRIMKTSSKIRIPYPPGIKYLFKNDDSLFFISDTPSFEELKVILSKAPLEELLLDTNKVGMLIQDIFMLYPSCYKYHILPYNKSDFSWRIDIIGIFDFIDKIEQYIIDKKFLLTLEISNSGKLIFFKIKELYSD